MLFKRLEIERDITIRENSLEEATIAQVKAKSWTPAFPWKALEGIMPSLMVEVTRAPTRTAPKNSMTAAARHACFKLSDFEDTEARN